MVIRMINDTTCILQPFFQEQCNPYFYSNTRAASLHTMHRSNYLFSQNLVLLASFGWVCISEEAKNGVAFLSFHLCLVVQLPSLVSHCSNWRCCCLITTTIFSLTSLAMIPGMFDEQDKSWKWNEEVRSPCFFREWIYCHISRFVSLLPPMQCSCLA